MQYSLAKIQETPHENWRNVYKRRTASGEHLGTSIKCGSPSSNGNGGYGYKKRTSPSMPGGTSIKTGDASGATCLYFWGDTLLYRSMLLRNMFSILTCPNIAAYCNDTLDLEFRLLPQARLNAPCVQVVSLRLRGRVHRVAVLRVRLHIHPGLVRACPARCVRLL